MQAKRLTKWAAVGGGRETGSLGRWFAVVGLAAAGWAVASWNSVGSAQDESPPPPRGAVPQEDRAEEGRAEQARPGRLGIGRLRGPVMNMMQFNQQFGNAGGHMYSRSTQNGVTTTVVKEQDQEIKIEETPDGIFMEIGRTYTRADVESLRSSHPELAKALESFPQTADGLAVQLSVRAVQKYEAINEDDLKEEYPEAFAQYRRVMAMGNGGSALGDEDGFEGMGFALPEIGFGPNVRQLREEMRQQQEEMRRDIEKMLERIR
jgi:hypothetical protein